MAIELSVSDAFATQTSEQSMNQPGYYADESHTVGVSEVCTQQLVPNRTRNKWDGSTTVEHKRDQPSPGKYRITGRREW